MRTAWFLLPLVGCYAPVGIDGAAPTGGGDVDTDGDGLVASIEAEIGSDPGNPDSDGDGYTDGVEYDGNADVLDPDHHPYAGGWSIPGCSASLPSARRARPGCRSPRASPRSGRPCGR